jgi:ssDNA-binding replication factor A large subunit
MAEQKQTRQPREYREARESRESREPRESREAKESKEAKEPAPKRKPSFSKVADLEPSSVGFNVVAQVVSKRVIRNRQNLDGTRLRIAEAQVGDDTGVVILSLRNDQIELVNDGDILILRNGKIDMVNSGYMRVAIDRWGLIEKAEEQKEMKVKTDNDLSAVEYELVPDESRQR